MRMMTFTGWGDSHKATDPSRTPKLWPFIQQRLGLSPDNRLPVVPKHALRSELRIGNEKLHVAPNLEWVPEGPWADYANTLRTDGYLLLGLSAGASVSEGFDLFLDVRNVTGKKAVGDISAAIRATPASVIYYPVERRAVYGGVRARF